MKKRVGEFLVLVSALAMSACTDDDSKRGDPAGPVGRSAERQISEALLPADSNPGLLGNEPHVAVNPTNAQNIVVAQFRSIAISTNGGVTFGAPIVMPLPATHNPASGGGDPVLAFDSQGRLFFTFLAQPVGATFNGPGGFDVFIQHLNPTTGAFLQPNGTACPGGCAVSVTGAVNLAAGSDAAPGPGNADKQWIAIDQNVASPFTDRIYMVWIDFRSQGIVTTFSSDQGANWAPFQALSTAAEGFTWPSHVAAAANGDVYLAYHSQPTFTPTALVDFNGDGTLDGQSGEPDGSGQIVLFRSPASQTTTGTCPNPIPNPAGGTICDGGVFDPATRSVFPADLSFNAQQCACTVAQVTGGTCPNTANQPNWRPCPRALNGTVAWTQGSAQPFIVPDPTNANNVAIVFSHDNSGTGAGNDGGANDDMDVRIARSTNFGAQGSFAIANVPTGGAGGLQMYPHAAIAPNSQCMSVAYYDDRNPNTGTGGSSLLDVFVMVSSNHGQTWFPQEVQINDTGIDQDTGNDRFPPPNPAIAPPGAWTPTVRIGEYFGLVHADGVAFMSTNAAGNQVIRFDYADGIPPTVTAPGPVTVGTCTPQESALGTASASDPCGRPPLTTDNDFTGTLNPGPNTINWTATDGALNVSAPAPQTVTVTDAQKPVFTFVPADVTVSDCSAPNIGMATATDTNTGNCGPVVVASDAPSVFPLGTTVVTWTATDAAGNVQTATQLVTAVLGDDPSCCPAGTNVILGTNGSDFIFGTSGADCILGRGGNDDLFGRDGNDFISGGEGNDDLEGDDGADYLAGGNGQDSLDGDSGNDTLLGGGGDDFLDAEGGNDVCEGGPGNDFLDGDSGSDILRGGAGVDHLEGDSGNDILDGGEGNDDLEGGLDNDALDGGPNIDECTGGLGNDTEVNCE